jgi:tetratricopeptide (TPR) repeat protein
VKKPARKEAEAAALQHDLNQGLNHHRTGNLPEAIKSYQRALKRERDNARIHNNLGAVLRDSGRYPDAAKHLRKAISFEPSLISAYLNLALCQLEMGGLDGALETYRSALLFGPNAIEARMGEANTLRDLGRMNEAAEAFKTVLKVQPGHAAAHYFLGHLRDHSLPDEYDQEYLAMRESYRASDAGSPARGDLAWAMARSVEQRGQYQESFDFLTEAHDIAGQTQDFDLKATSRYFAEIRSAWSALDIAPLAVCKKPKTARAVTPIFVLGLARSGTTLVEQILATHDTVFGAGEQRLIGNLCAHLEVTSGRNFAEALAVLEPRAIQSLADSYLEKLTELAPHADYIVDKMPANFLSLGLIALLFPRAKIIHCERDPMAVCWSIYSTRFAEPHPFAHDLSNLGGYHHLCHEHMSYWRQQYPNRIHTVNYEPLVHQPERNVRALVEYCGLEYNDGYLNFHETQRPVRTASAMQVRKPLYQSAAERYLPFEPYLQTLRKALEEKR